jgi:hypothetical protein
LYHTSNQVNTPDISKVFTKEELTNITEFYIPFPKLGKLPGHYIRESYRYSELVYELFKENANVDFVYSKNTFSKLERTVVDRYKKYPQGKPNNL